MNLHGLPLFPLAHRHLALRLRVVLALPLDLIEPVLGVAPRTYARLFGRVPSMCKRWPGWKIVELLVGDPELARPIKENAESERYKDGVYSSQAGESGVGAG